jgi:SAM-dependent methyltransferase
MNNKKQSSTDNWKDFWNNYSKVEAKNETDLYIQVGKTANKKPISMDLFQVIIKDVVENLNLKHDDVLLEMCCGNGLFTCELNKYVNHIYAFDFTEQLILTAKQFKQKENITYLVGNAKEDFTKLYPVNNIPNKFLMSDAMAYFNPEELEIILKRLLKITNTLRFYITNVPDDALKWNFYNTPERKEKYENHVSKGDGFFDGIGRWWKMSEFKAVAEKFDLNIKIVNLDNELLRYRSNILITKELI